MSTITLAVDFKVSDILIEGNTRVESSTVLAAVSLNVGDQISMDDIDQALHDIFALGYFEDVAAELTEVQGGAKIVTYVVKELPLIRRIEIEGNEELKKW